jgi:hypothetical protein
VSEESWAVGSQADQAQETAAVAVVTEQTWHQQLIAATQERGVTEAVVELVIKGSLAQALQVAAEQTD